MVFEVVLKPEDSLFWLCYVSHKDYSVSQLGVVLSAN